MVSMEQFQQMQFEMGERMDTIGGQILSQFTSVSDAAKAAVEERFASAQIGFKAEQDRVTELVNSLHQMIKEADTTNLAGLAGEINNLKSHEEERAKVLRQMFSDEATLVRGEMFKIHVAADETKRAAVTAFADLRASIAERPQQTYIGDQEGGVKPSTGHRAPRMRIPDPGGWK